MIRIFLLVSLLSIALGVHAQDASSGSPSESTDDVDTIITNKRMRAESGSKSKYSVSIGLSYSAGSLEDPLGVRRPNITGAPGSTDVTLLSGSVSGKYSLTTQSSFFVGLGWRWITPFAGMQVPAGYPGDKFDADNPSISYQFLYKWFARIQSAFSASESFYTNSNLVHLGYLTSWGVAQNNLYEIPSTRMSVGFSINAGGGVFTKNDPVSEAQQGDYNFGLSPFFEIRLTDRLDLNTSANLIGYQHLRSQPNGAIFNTQTITQTLNLGISLTRDFFVNPSINWVPGNLQAKSTLVGLGVSLNLF